VDWREVEQVLLSRLEWERLPLTPIGGGGIHVGALDAMAGLSFRIVAIPGLGEGVYPPVLRPDPLLPDRDREALGTTEEEGGPQLSLFPPPSPLRTTQDRLKEARRLFHRAASQATERLVLSYPRADARSGRERMPSGFFVAAASTLLGRPLSLVELSNLLSEDEPDRTEVAKALDRSERDLFRIRENPKAEERIAAGSVFFRQSRLAGEARRRDQLTAFDGFVSPLPGDLAEKLDPVTARNPMSASRLATFGRCGFQYFLQHVLRLEPDPEPEERKRLDPLEKGSLFHEVAETFLRERRERGELPLEDTLALRERLRLLGDQALDGLVQSSPPRFTVLWKRERERFHDGLVRWFAREIASRDSVPALFEVSFGMGGAPGPESFPEPLTIELGDGRTLRVSGRIDRIDRRDDGTLVLRDYKTGRAWRDEGAVFQGGKQLQMSFYTLAADRFFPKTPVVKAFLDFVDGGREIVFDIEGLKGDAFRGLLRGLVDAIAQGVFVQEPSSCDLCDFTDVCGPKALLERRRRNKKDNRLIREVMKLRGVR
jgi:ATP-dependent helicase/DNAse subunit B